MTDTPTRTRRLRADEPDLMEALLVGAGPHLEPLLDVGTTASGDLVLVLPEPAVRLADLLLGAGLTRPGEAVTVLVPLAGALERLHEAGVALGGVDGSQVVLDADGTPAWSPERAVLLRRIGPAAFSAAVAEDQHAFATLADGLLQRTGLPPSARGRTPAELVDVLFALAEPVPVRLRATASVPLPGALPGRLLGAEAPAPEAAEGRRDPLAPLRSALGQVRPRMWALLGGVAALLLAAVLVLPGGGPAEGAAGGGPMTAPARPAPSRSVTTVAARDLAAPVAVQRLLDERRRCLAEGDRACLEAVSSVGSPVRQADRAALEAGVDAVPADGEPRVVSTGVGTAVARAGGAVVVGVRETDGWRLRDVVAEPPG
ncbi:hypothetical protein [Amnibacterium endophyticum]|uniref:Uncharacterized protein n=1 Tax=Amnibacterium endophyticum TaxID=2109337 RepID=A0ABW4LI65_9MICO